ncbi:MAG: AI-2E family transporter [Myxococcales bacterium]
MTRNGRRALRLVLAASLAATALFFRGVALPFLLGALLAYLLDPAVGRLAALKLRGHPVPRWAAILGLYAAGAALVALAASLTVPQLLRELARLSAKAGDLATQLTPERLAQWAAGLSAWLSAHGVPLGIGSGDESHFGVDPGRSLREAAASIITVLRGHLFELLSLGPRLVRGVVAGLFEGLLVLMITAFLLVHPEPLFAFARGLVPRTWRGSWDELLHRVDRGLAGVVRGQLSICLINGGLTFVGLSVLGVPFAYALALLATALAFIPIFGTFVSSVPIVLAGLSRGLHVGLLILLWILGVHALEAYVLNPKIMGDASRLHPLLILFALLAGEHYFGLLGAIFAVPAASLAASLFQHLYAQLDA